MRIVIAIAIVKGERSEEHTSELQSQSNLVCRLLLEKKKKKPHSDMSSENTIKITRICYFLQTAISHRGMYACQQHHVCTRSNMLNDPAVLNWYTPA